jgi:outer membrane protein assembly factor BamB
MSGQVVRQWWTGGGVVSTPSINADGVLYTNTPKLMAFHPELSMPLWTLESGASELSPVVDSTGRIYAGSPSWGLVGVGADGYRDWYVYTGIGRSSPALHPEGFLCLGSSWGRLLARNPDSTMRWELQLPEQVRSTPMIGPEGTIYVGCDNGRLYAVDAAGIIKWSYQTGSDIVSSPGRDSTGRIFFGSDDSCVYAVEDSGSYAKLRWRYKTGGSVQSSPAVSADGLVYIGSDDGLLYCFRGSDSTVLWSRTTGGAVRSSPAIGGDGAVYVGSNDGRLYAIGEGVGVTEERALSARSIDHGRVCAGVLTVPPQTTSSVLDITGRRVMELKPGPNDVSRLAPGVYFIVQQGPRVQGPTGSRQKVVIAR